MSAESVKLIEAALAKVIDPELRKPLTELGMVKSIDISGDLAKIGIYLTIAGCPMKDRLYEDISNAVIGIAGIKRVSVDFDVMSDEQRNEIKRIIRGGNEKSIPFARPDSLTRVFAIASGKGGVGKSSVTANLAVALAGRGQRVGILDADVYGHSIPRILGMLGARPTAIDNTTFIPLKIFGASESRRWRCSNRNARIRSHIAGRFFIKFSNSCSLMHSGEIWISYC